MNKKPGNLEPLHPQTKEVSFEFVMRQCFKDPAFFDALCKNTGNALLAMEIQLNRADRKRLDKYMATITSHEKKIYHMVFTYMRPKPGFWATVTLPTKVEVRDGEGQEPGPDVHKSGIGGRPNWP